MPNNHHRIVIFCSDSWMSFLLIEGFLKAIARRGEIEDVLIVGTNKIRRSPFLGNKVNWYFKQIIKKIFNWKYRLKLDIFWYGSIQDLSRVNKFEYVNLPDGGINSSFFLKKLDSWGPTCGISLGCAQILGADILAKFSLVINYHNGLLPKYRGVFSTHWSIYNSEKISGFSFHAINTKIDRGNIFIQDAVKISKYSNVDCVEIKKIKKALFFADQVLDFLIFSNGNRGKKQPSLTCDDIYYGFQDVARIKNIFDPTKFESDDLMRVISIFGSVNMSFEGQLIQGITKICQIESSQMNSFRLTFATKDGRFYKVDRILNMPLKIFFLIRCCRNLANRNQFYG